MFKFLRNDHINDIRKSKNKPIVKDVIKCVLILLDKPISKIAIFSEVNKDEFFKKIEAYDVEKRKLLLTDEAREIKVSMLNYYTKNENFDVYKIADVSIGASYLSEWILKV